MERSVIDTGSTMNINQSTAHVEESAPSAATEFTTRQLVSSPVGIAQNNFSTVVDKLKLFRELLTNLTKEPSNEMKSALIANRNQLEAYLEKIKETKECLTKQREKTISALDKKLNRITSAIERMQLLQGETRAEIEKKWFDTIELTYPNVKTLEDLIQRGVDVNAEDAKGHNALHLVCMKKDNNENLVDLVRLLIENGVDVNAKNSYGMTALQHLCRDYKNDNLINIVRLFVENGVDVDAKDNNGEAPRDLIRKHYKKENAQEILKLLSSSGSRSLRLDNID